MLTNEDIKKIISVVATKEDVDEIKKDVSGLRESVQALIVSVDGLTKSIDDLKIEYIAITSKINRHEKWIQKIAEKIGVELEY